MFRLLADENFNNHIVRGLLRRSHDLDIVRVQDVGLLESDDPTILDWAAKNGRIVITHDVSTMAHFAHQRVKAGLPMPGIFEVHESVSIRQAIEDILVLAECSLEEEWESRVCYLPL